VVGLQLIRALAWLPASTVVIGVPGTRCCPAACRCTRRPSTAVGRGSGASPALCADTKSC